MIRGKKAGLKGKLFFVLAIIAIIYLYQSDYLSTEMIGWKARDQVTGYVTFVDPVYEESGVPIELYFCPSEDCESALLKEINSARKRSIDCAFFDLNLPNVISALEAASRKAEVRLVVDDNNFEDVIDLEFAKQDDSSQYMHDKFCVIDDSVVITGSMNPTVNGVTKNNNNLLVIVSDTLADNYKSEFKELWSDNFGDGKRTKDPIVILDNKTIKNYFCPDDWCASKITAELDKAETSVKFMTFSFTSEPIARKLIELHNRNISIEGVMEVTQKSKYSKLNELRDAGILVNMDVNPYKMHHKVFIIDNKTVITGSMNPSKSGDLVNDENVIIIEDEAIAKRFLEEFSKM